MMFIGGRYEAFKRVRQFLFLKHKIRYNMYRRNKGRHMIMAPEMIRTTPVYWVMYKKEWFYTFPQKFPEHVKKVPEDNEFAQTINVECINQALREKAHWIIVAMPNVIYRMSTRGWLNYATEHGLVRAQKGFNRTIDEFTNLKVPEPEEVEKTFCMPARFFEVFMEVEHGGEKVKHSQDNRSERSVSADVS